MFNCRMQIDVTTVGLSNKFMMYSVWGRSCIKAGLFILLLNLEVDRKEELCFLGIIILIFFLIPIISLA